MTKQIESPNRIYGRLKEGAHIGGYSFERVLENFRWLLEEKRWQELGFDNFNDFLHDIEGAFAKFKLLVEQRKNIVKLIKEQDETSSQRAIAGVVGVSKDTIRNDMGGENSPADTHRKGAKARKRGENSPPPTTRTGGGQQQIGALLGVARRTVSDWLNESDGGSAKTFIRTTKVPPKAKPEIAGRPPKSLADDARLFTAKQEVLRQAEIGTLPTPAEDL
jgi:DNA-binding XRE family transcriptional regulator